MKKLERIRKLILSFIDFFHPPFRKFIPLQTFRYAACGGSNAVLNLLIFYLGYNFIFKNNVVNLLGFSVTRYIAAYILALFISFPLGFFLNKYIVFQQSNLQGHIQLVRYASITLSSILFDYSLLHLLVGYFKFWATPSQAFIIVLLSLYSYFCQTYFTFKTIKK
ncbi:GtrA family protein [Pedobacter sp. ASV28]|uniref:GtrA family protein n=1 Tax=Pedobacter sp. ASV28 TaxID=2795123 RepID=UPI0018EBB17B|nr:GtrA family protein [Pedobacter sp. ASV28]